MSQAFRELLKKVGSGEHTAIALTRQEAKDAMGMMLLQEATPAQIGAFMIAHRIKRPTPEELAGMLDAYDQLGPKLAGTNLNFPFPVTVFGNPYDGRSRTAPVTVMITLILAAAGAPVILHGGECMPTKYGMPLVEVWQALGVDFTLLSLHQAQQLLEATGIAFIYLPQHFPLAQNLVPYREQIGKRPPIATLELMWLPYTGTAHLVSGFVHPPTEERFRQTFALRGVENYTTVKGLEGSCDLARSRTGIIGLGQTASQPDFERLHLHPRDYDLAGQDFPLDSLSDLTAQMQQILAGGGSELSKAVLLNGGFYLWRCGVCADIATGIAKTKDMLIQGQVSAKLAELRQTVADFELVASC